MKLSCSLSFFQRSRLVDVDACSFSLNLSDWTSEPLPSPQKPTPKNPYSNNANGDWSIIKRLGIHRVGGWQTEDDADETNPADSDQANYARSGMKIERAFLEVAGPDDGDQDWQAVRDIQANGSDGSCSGESHSRTK